MERYKFATMLLSDNDVRVLMESLWHSVQRGDVPDEDRERMHKLYNLLGEKFKASESGGTVEE